MALNPRDLQAARSAIDRAEKILVIPHANVDPDALSSALACYQMFRSLGKECTVICPDTLPESLQFLPGFESIAKDIAGEQNFVLTLDCSSGVEVDKLRYNIEDQKVNIIVIPKKGRFKKEDVSVLEGGSSYDLLVVVDSAELALLGSVYTDFVDLFSEIPVLNIDHHVSNTQFGQLHLIDPTAASATEVLYHWFSADPKWKKLITSDIATLLLTGLITDTRSFQNPNTTPRSLEVAAELIDLQARQQEIIQHIYKTKPLSTLKIWGRALNRIQFDQTARIVWSAISREDLAEMGSQSKETQGILDELLSTIPDADVYALFTEVEEGGLKASLRSGTAIDVNVAAQRTFGGGGHARAAGFKVKQYGNFQVQVVECVQRLIAEMRRQRESSGGEGEMPARQATLRPASPVKSEKEASQKPKAATGPTIDIVGELSADRKDKKDGTDIVEELEGDRKNSKYEIRNPKEV